MIPFRAAAAKREAERELPVGWSVDRAPTWDARLREFVVCAGSGHWPFPMRGGHGRTKAAAWRDLAHRLRQRRRHVQHPTRLAALMFALSLPLLLVSPSLAGDVAIPSPTAKASDPAPTPTLMLLAPVATDYLGSGPALYVSPSPPPINLRVGHPVNGLCPAPNYGDRRAANSPDAQAYLRSRLSQREFNCAWWIVLQESSWRASALSRYASACGLPQAHPCSKLANFIARRHPGEPTYSDRGKTWAIDWRLYPRDQIDWLIAYVHGRYGSFLGAASFKFGWCDHAGCHSGRGYY
jgi:hypothetical protein